MDRVGHLNTILALGGREFENSKVQIPGLCPGGGRGELKFRVDRRVRVIYILLIKRSTSLVHTKLPQNSPSQLKPAVSRAHKK